MSADDACQCRVGGVALQCKTLIEKCDTAFEIAGSPREPEGRERPCPLGDVADPGGVGESASSCRRWSVAAKGHCRERALHTLGRHELGPKRAQDPDKAKSRDRVAGREVPVECGPDVVELREQRAVRGVLAWATHIIGEAVNQAGEVLGMPGTNGDLFAAAGEMLVWVPSQRLEHPVPGRLSLTFAN